MASQLATFQTDDLTLSLMQNSWTKSLNPLLVNPSLNTIILKKVVLSAGTNTINHLLGRSLQGYRVVRQRSAANIYDKQDDNQRPQLTLILVSDATVTVDLEVF